MKRTGLIKHLVAHECQLLREGSRHSIWWNPANRKTSTVPRHGEIVEPTAHRICKDLGISKPEQQEQGFAQLGTRRRPPRVARYSPCMERVASLMSRHGEGGAGCLVVAVPASRLSR